MTATGSNRHRARTARRDALVTVGYVMRAVAAALSLSLVVGSCYVWATYRSFSQNVTHLDAIAPGTSGQDIDGRDQNILLVGDDHRPADASPALLAELSTQQDGGGVNTDTMMVLHVPADGSKATLISFPRDSWVDIPGHGKGKLNSAFNLGAIAGGGDSAGARLLIQVIENLTGLTIDHFVRVSMVGFYQIAQVLGPIQVCLNQAVNDHYSGTNLPAGVSTLDAKQALSFVRQRHGLPRGDLDREVRQQYFLSTEFRKIAATGTLLNPLKLQHLLSAVSGALETDPGLNLLTFAAQMQNLQAGNLKSATIPITGTPTISVDGTDVSIVAVDFTALPAFITEVIGEPDAYTHADAAAPSTVTVTVVNATGTSGLAASQSAALQSHGFATGAPTSAAATTVTTVSYPPGMEAQAKAVAAAVPGAIAVPDPKTATLTLTLGTDGRRAAVVATTPSSNTPLSTTQPPATSTPTPTPTGTGTGPARAYGAADCIN